MSYDYVKTYTPWLADGLTARERVATLLDQRGEHVTEEDLEELLEVHAKAAEQREMERCVEIIREQSLLEEGGRMTVQKRYRGHLLHKILRGDDMPKTHLDRERERIAEIFAVTVVEALQRVAALRTPYVSHKVSHGEALDMAQRVVEQQEERGDVSDMILRHVEEAAKNLATPKKAPKAERESLEPWAADMLQAINQRTKGEAA